VWIAKPKSAMRRRTIWGPPCLDTAAGTLATLDEASRCGLLSETEFGCAAD
jgi:hypothetical protein